MERSSVVYQVIMQWQTRFLRRTWYRV